MPFKGTKTCEFCKKQFEAKSARQKVCYDPTCKAKQKAIYNRTSNDRKKGKIRISKNHYKNNLTQDLATANSLGLSYGQYMARKMEAIT